MDAGSYRAQYARSLSDPAGFWGEKARSELSWFRDFTTPLAGGFAEGDVRWFSEGQLNVCYNCVDRCVVAALWAESRAPPAALTLHTPPPPLSLPSIPAPPFTTAGCPPAATRLPSFSKATSRVR